MVAVLALLVARPVFHVARVALSDHPIDRVIPPGHVDDASHLDLTPVGEILDVPVELPEAETVIAAALERARARGMRVAIAGARHTMGGQTIAANGLALNMLPLHRLSLEEEGSLLRAQSGALWVARFFAGKRRHDPGELFSSEVYRRYGSAAPLGGGQVGEIAFRPALHSLAAHHLPLPVE